MRYQTKLFFSFLFLLLLAPIGVRALTIEVTATIEITATVSGCGDDAIGGGEQCDGANLGGASCSSQGFSSGTLSCTSACTFDTTACTVGGGLIGGSGSRTIPNTNVVFVGKAYPESTVFLLKDAQEIATTVADQEAKFQVAISNLSSGNYMFSVYTKDIQGVKSLLYTFPVYVTSGATTKVSEIFIPPSLATDKTEVKKGDPLKIFGQTVPQAKVLVNINSEEEITVEETTDNEGNYSFDFDSLPLERGLHTAKAKAVVGEEISTFSSLVNFIVGTQNVLNTLPIDAVNKGDLNQDKKVNLVDFSIAAFWYKREPDANFLRIEAERLNGDGELNLADFSILAFYWTG